MPRGDKSAYTDKQKRQAEHIEEGYEKSGLSEDEAERRAWATVNAMTGGGKKVARQRPRGLRPQSPHQRRKALRHARGRSEPRLTAAQVNSTLTAAADSYDV
jgi:plasmid stabilization system protein ParE